MQTQRELYKNQIFVAGRICLFPGESINLNGKIDPNHVWRFRRIVKITSKPYEFDWRRRKAGISS